MDHIIRGNADYVVVLGTTGESVTLSKDEKKAVVNYIVEAANDKIPVVVGIGGNNTQEVISSMAHYDLTNIAAVLSVAPYYNKPSQEGMYQHFKNVAAACPLPLILYNVPGRTGSNMSAQTTLRLAKDCKNVTAIKEASGNLVQVMQILHGKPKDFIVISGDDVLTLPMIALGASGVISVLANSCPREVSDMVNYALKGDLTKARVLHFRLLNLMQAIFEEGSPSGIKALLEGLKLIQNNVRLPLAPVSEGHYKKLQQLMKELYQV